MTFRIALAFHDLGTTPSISVMMACPFGFAGFKELLHPGQTLR
jgi:hypothetical protein